MSTDAIGRRGFVGTLGAGQTLMPLAPGRATFTKADVEAVLTRTAGGRVATDIGAIVIESPIRRLSGQMFDWDEAKRISAFARAKGIGMHLDGARAPAESIRA